MMVCSRFDLFQTGTTSTPASAAFMHAASWALAWWAKRSPTPMENFGSVRFSTATFILRLHFNVQASGLTNFSAVPAYRLAGRRANLRCEGLAGSVQRSQYSRRIPIYILGGTEGGHQRCSYNEAEHMLGAGIAGVRRHDHGPFRAQRLILPCTQIEHSGVGIVRPIPRFERKLRSEERRVGKEC